MNARDPEATLPDLKTSMDGLMKECMEILMSYPCRISIETRAHLEDEARRTIDKPIPDFAQREYVQDLIPRELQVPVMEIMAIFQMGKRGTHEELLRACAMLERGLLQLHDQQ